MYHYVYIIICSIVYNIIYYCPVTRNTEPATCNTEPAMAYPAPQPNPQYRSMAEILVNGPWILVNDPVMLRN